MSTMTFLSTCDIFRSYTCHIMVHCLLLIVLFATHPHSVYLVLSNFQNSNATCSVPYSAFLNFKYNIGLLFLVLHMYFLYSFGSNLMINSTIVPSSSICTFWSIYMCRKSPGMFVTVTCLPSLVSIAHDNIIASSDTVGELSTVSIFLPVC